MKKLLFLLSLQLSVLGCQVCFGQKYIPFNFDNGIWSNVEYNKFGLYGQPTSYYYTYYTEGDSLINNIKYYKLYFLYHAIPSLGPQQPIYTLFWGFIRNDSINKQVKAIQGNHPEKVIYDFNHTVGDSIAELGIHLVKIESIDSVNICGKYHKRFLMNQSGMFYKYTISDKIALIEGIGYNSGFINPCFDCFEYCNTLTCYTERNNYDCERCADWAVGMKEDEIRDEDFNISPNPATDYLNIEMKAIKMTEAFRVFSLLGKEVLSGVIKPGENKKRIDVSLLKSGVYFITCGTRVTKFVKE